MNRPNRAVRPTGLTALKEQNQNYPAGPATIEILSAAADVAVRPEAPANHVQAPEAGSGIFS